MARVRLSLAFQRFIANAVREVIGLLQKNSA
jgi:hypothetical protein